jgi:hypothetical protein
MSFWESDLGEITGKEEDAFAKQFTQIPDGTMALAKIDSFTNQEYQGFKYLLIEWLLTDGDFKGQKVQQKLKVFGGNQYDKDSAKTKHRALNMFKLMYQMFNMKPKHSNDPTDQDLAAFIGKIAGIKIRETEPNAEGRQYNWVAEIHDSKGFKSETGISVVVTHSNTHYGQDREPLDSAFHRNNNAQNSQLTDDIPF